MIYLEKGNVNYYHLKYNLANEDYLKVISLKPNLAEANYMLGFCKLKSKDTLSACNYWNNMEELDDYKDYELIKTICNKK